MDNIIILSFIFFKWTISNVILIVLFNLENPAQHLQTESLTMENVTKMNSYLVWTLLHF